MDALSSINEQTYPNIEIYIIDDNSSDNSYNICKEWATYSRFPVNIQKNDINVGLTKNCDTLLNLANGKYLQLFDQDDIMLPNKIEHDVSVFEQLARDVGVLYSRVKLIDEKGQLMKQEYNERINFDGILKEDVFAQLIKSNFIPAPTAMLRTETIKKTGGYDESIVFNDWDMWLRVAKDFKFFFDDVTNVHYRIHNESMMASRGVEQQMTRNEITMRMMKKHFGYSKEHDKLLLDKLKELSVYSYFLGDKNAAQYLHLYLQNNFDTKVWLYHKMAFLGIRHPSQFLKLFKGQNSA